jgi:sec-independent protein translocase protein TatA
MGSMPNIGLPEIIIVLVIALVIFGPKRLPELGRSLGNGMREFKDSISGKSSEEEKHEQHKHELQASSQTTEPVEGEVVETRS